MSSTGISVGLKKGYPVTKKEQPKRPSQKKAVISKRTRMVRDLVQEVVGLSPYEKRLLDMLKTGGASSEKRMYKYAKRRVRFSPPLEHTHYVACSACAPATYNIQ